MKILNFPFYQTSGCYSQIWEKIWRRNRRQRENWSAKRSDQNYSVQSSAIHFYRKSIAQGILYVWTWYWVQSSGWKSKIVDEQMVVWWKSPLLDGLIAMKLKKMWRLGASQTYATIHPELLRCIIKLSVWRTAEDEAGEFWEIYKTWRSLIRPKPVIQLDAREG